jgi:hypothetical protein
MGESFPAELSPHISFKMVRKAGRGLPLFQAAIRRKRSRKTANAPVKPSNIKKQFSSPSLDLYHPKGRFLGKFL